MNAALRRVLPLVPSILLCLVAGVQIYLVKAQDLTPWKGGGFGMFSTNDDGFRRMLIWVEEPGGEREIDVTGDLRALRIAAHPTPERLSSMARKIGEVQQARGATVTRVRVAVWRRSFAPATMEPLQVPIREVVVDLSESWP